MTKNCLVCGRSFDAKRKAAKYCGDTCRKRAQRRSDVGGVIALPSAQGSEPVEVAEGSVAAATRVELESVGRTDTALGATALALAARIDQSDGDTGAAVASLTRELRATLAEALDGAERADDPLLKVRASALRVVAG